MNLNWWLHSDAGLAARVAIGASVLAVLAASDLYRNRGRATRWREYGFLVGCVAAALVYGAANDQVTTTISWEYFAYGKAVAEALPPGEPPNSAAFRWEAAKVGMRATWSAGLIVGVALLIANNPRRDGRPRLSYAALARLVPLVFGAVVLSAVVLGAAGYLGAFAPVNEDFRAMLRRDLWRPRRFMAVYGMHTGAYVGGVLGTVIAVVRGTRARRRGADDELAFPVVVPPK